MVCGEEQPGGIDKAEACAFSLRAGKLESLKIDIPIDFPGAINKQGNAMFAYSQGRYTYVNLTSRMAEFSFPEKQQVHIPSFSSNGDLLTVNGKGEIVRFRTSNQEIERLYVPKTRALTLQWLPDEISFSYASCEGMHCTTYLVSGSPYTAKKIIEANSPAAYVTTGHWIAIEGTNIVAFEAKANWQELTGKRTTLVSNALNSSRFLFDLNANGVMMYAVDQETPRSILSLVDRKGNLIRELDSNGLHFTPKLSPDGKLLAFAEGVYSVSRSIWILDLERGIKRKLTNGLFDDGVPVWSRDGNLVAFASNRCGIRGLWELQANGMKQPQKLAEIPGNSATPGSYAPDMRSILFQHGSVSYALDRNTGNLTELKPEMTAPRISPDGKWLAYEYGNEGKKAVYLSRYPPTGEVWQISDLGGLSPVWRADMKELFFARGADLNSAEISWIHGEPQPQKPQKLFSRELIPAEFRNGYDASADGNSFVITKPVVKKQPRPRVMVVLNWQRLLE